MNHIQQKKIILIITLVIIFSLVPIEKVFGQSSALNPNNAIRITTKNCVESDKNSRVAGKDRCCLKQSNACQKLFSLKTGTPEYQKCIVADLKISLSGNDCSFTYNTVDKLDPSVEFGFDYVTAKYCAKRFGVSDSQSDTFHCFTPPENQVIIGPDEYGKWDPIRTVAKWCFGPGGSSDKIFQSGRLSCCPKYDKNSKKWEFWSTDFVNPFPSPLVPWSQCPEGQAYMTSNNISSSNIKYKELTPEEVCTNDSLIESNNQKASQIKDQCCTCISGSASCPPTWDAILKDDTLKNNSWTGLGCINRSQTGLAISLMRIFFGVGLVLLLLKIIAIGFDYQSGDPEKIKDARYGILAVIVSFAVGTIGLIALRFVGLDVLGLGASTDIGNLLPIFK